MSNAAKLKKKAAEFEQKKQFDKALQLYIQILDESVGEDDEADVALYNRVGDLLMRQGSVGDAVNYYEKAVDLYAESGFFNNAIALCNKILRQSPGRNSIYYKLGKISAKKGFISDAKQNFLEYADRMQKAGQLDEAFRALKEFADLCPDQDDIRLMLAEQLSKKDRKAEAIEQLQHLYEKFTAEGRANEARATLDRMKAIDPHAEPGLKSGSGSRNPKSSDLVFLDLDDSKPAAAAAAPKAKAPPVAPPAPKKGAKPAPLPELPPLEDEVEIDDDLLPLPPLDGELEPLDPLDPLEPLEESLEPLDVLDDSDVEVTGLETMAEFSADVAASATISGFEQTGLDGDLDADLPALLPDLEPPLSESEFDDLALPEVEDDILPHAHPAHDLALPGRLPALDASVRSPMSLTGEMELIIPEGDDDLLPPRRPAPPPAPARPAASKPAAAKPAAGLPPLEFTPEVDTSDMTGGDPGGDSGLSLIGGAESLDVNEAELPSWMSEGTATNGTGHHDADVPLLDLDAETPALDDGMLSLDAPVVPPKPKPGPKPRSAPPRPAPVPAAVPAAKAPPHRHSHTPLARSVDKLRQQATANPANWGIRQQYAEALLEDGEREAGLQELEVVMLGLERGNDLRGAQSVADEIIRLNPNSVKHHQKRVEYAFRAADKPRLADAYLELADAMFRDGHAEKARVVYQRVLELSPTDARAQAALSTFAEAAPAKPQPKAEPKAEPKAARPTTPVRAAPARPAAPASAADDDFVNLSDWLREEEAPKSTRMVVDEEAPSGDEQADFEEMLRKFKQGVAENVEDEDYESHYDLGVAYKEMGLVDEAISEFQKALRGSSGRVRTYEALGQCFLEKQQFQVAATILGRALSEPSSTDDQLVGVLYLLGYASEALRHWPDAVAYYQRVFAVDIQFRDVADRLAALEKVPRR